MQSRREHWILFSMSDADERTINADFEITDWQSDDYEVEGTNCELSRVRVIKQFEGSIRGTSTADLLMAGNPHGAGYVASEIFTGTVDGLSGSMVIQHWGVAEGTVAASSGHVIPGSGTEELSGIAGKAIYSQDAAGQHRLELQVTFANQA